MCLICCCICMILHHINKNIFFTTLLLSLLHGNSVPSAQLVVSLAKSWSSQEAATKDLQ